MTTDMAMLERVIIGGDLSKLQPLERLEYYRAVCTSLSLNPLTKPFEYLHLNGKLVLYARRDATDQLRKLHGVSVAITAREQQGDVYAVVARATDPHGRADESIGAVATVGLKGEALANALMKAETKAKRRVTLSLCGLGMLDETELETIPAEALTPVPVEADPMPRAELADWLESFRAVESRTALEALWRSLTVLDLWKTFPAPEQVQLVAAKNDAKKRLGVA